MFAGSQISLTVTSFRAVLPAAAAGLGLARRGPGDVCQQPPEWPRHFCRPHPAELLVGPKWLCGHALCNHFRSPIATEQV